MKKTNDPIEFGELADHTGYHIRRAHSMFMRLFANVGKGFTIRSQQSSILVLTRENPGISPAAIASAIGIERSLMARLLSELQEQGFIKTLENTEDGRQKALFITPSGRKFIRKVMDTFWTTIEPELTQNLSESEKRTLIRLLSKIYNEA